MIRRLFGKLMWLGRATSALVGLVVLFALAIGAANSALAHTNIDTKLFHLGHNNPVGRLSALTGTLTGALLKLDNNGTGPALLLEAGTDAPPLKVNAAAGTATNLSADELDGKDSSEFYAAGSKVADSTHAEQADSATEAQNAANADTLDSLDSADFQRRVSGQCAPGSSIRSIGADGTTLACESDDDLGGDAAGGDLSGNYPNPQIAQNAVSGGEINDESITRDDIRADAIDTDELSPNAATTREIADGSLDVVDLAEFQTDYWLDPNPLNGGSCATIESDHYVFDSVDGGDLVLMNAPSLPSGLVVFPLTTSSSDPQVTFRLCNITSGSIDAGEHFWRIFVFDDGDNV